MVWQAKKDKGVALGQPMEGIEIPVSLQRFAEDLRRMHRIA